jgi:hypothetical protein
LEEYLVDNEKFEGSRPTCAEVFSDTPPENSDGAGKFSRKFRHKWKNFFG